METKPKVALFLGSDIVSNLMMNELVPDLMSRGYQPVLYFPKHPASNRANLPEVVESAFFERHILNDTIFPFLEQHPYVNQQNLSPEQLADRYDLHLERVDNVNAPAFIDGLKGMENLLGAFSIRCFQIFKQDIITVLNSKGSEKNPSFFYNLHPGLLPQYRGVMSTARAMAATAMKTNGQSYGCTLHVIDAGIDTGDILWPKARPFDMSQTVYTTNLSLAQLGVQAIKQVFTELENGNSIVPMSQDMMSTPKNYFTYPTADELALWKKAGVRLFDREEVIMAMVDLFSKRGTPHATKLEHVVREATEKHAETLRQAAVTPQKKALNDNPLPKEGQALSAPQSNKISPAFERADTQVSQQVTMLAKKHKASKTTNVETIDTIDTKDTSIKSTIRGLFPISAPLRGAHTKSNGIASTASSRSLGKKILSDKPGPSSGRARPRLS